MPRLRVALLVGCLGLLTSACGDDTSSNAGTGASSATTTGSGATGATDTGGTGAGASGGSSSGGQGGAGGETPTGTPTIVAVGYGGRRIRSLDLGVTWTDLVEDDPAGGDDENLLRAAVYAEGRFVATGWRIHSSVDGVTWSEHTVEGQNWCGGVDYGNGRFVCAGGCGMTLYSDDGTAWVDGASATTGGCTHVRSLAFGNGVFAAAGDGGFIVTTTDGESWTPAQDLPINRVRFRDGLFIGEGDGGEHMTSTDGVDWQDAAGSPNTHDFGHGYYFRGQWQGIIERSPDGDRWTEVFDDAGNHLQAFAFGYSD